MDGPTGSVGPTGQQDIDVIFQQVTSAVTSSYVVPGGTLTASPQSLRVSFQGDNAEGGNATARVSFGGNILASWTVSSADNMGRELIITAIDGSNVQWQIDHGGSSPYNNGSVAINLSLAQTILVEFVAPVQPGTTVKFLMVEKIG